MEVGEEGLGSWKPMVLSKKLLKGTLEAILLTPNPDYSFRCLGESPSHQIFVEKALTGPSWKHIEVQIVGDRSGFVTHLWERECSVQRR
jgi:hypothetical protein